MKKLYTVIGLALLLGILSGCGSKNKTEPEVPLEEKVVSNTQSTDVASSKETQVVSEKKKEDIVSKVDSNTTKEDNASIAHIKEELLSTNTIKELSKFEKTFIRHIAYNHYKKAIDLLYMKNHQEAYSEAMSAKAVYDANATQKEIILPYLPGYVRESAQTPRRIYYKILVDKNYELHRLIKKIKLLSPPVPMVVLNQTSTYVDIEVKNFGDLPLDNFGIEVNFEKVKTFPKINPKESVTYRFDKAVVVEQIRFSEEFGFAPKEITFEKK